MLSGFLVLLFVPIRQFVLQPLALLLELIEFIVPEGVEVSNFLIVLVAELILLFSVFGLHFIV